MYYFENGKLRMENRRTSISEARTIRIVIMGDREVGKSTIARGLVGKTGCDTPISSEHDFHEGLVETGDKFSRLEIIDMSGNYEFPSMRSLAISLADICILVYSMDRRNSLESLKKLDKEIRDIRGPKKTMPVAILGNKLDCSCKELAEDEALYTVSTNFDYPHAFFSAKYTFGMTDLLKWLMSVTSGVDGLNTKLPLVTPPRKSRKLWKKLRSRITSTKSPDFPVSLASDPFSSS